MKRAGTLTALAAIAASLALLSECSPPVSYSPATADQEGRPVKITADQDSVAGCTVFWKGKSWTYDMRERFCMLPNESGIAFMSRNSGKSRITVKMLSGSCREFFRPLSGEAIDPSVSPDGKRLSFSRLDHGAWNLYEMDLDGSPATSRITNERAFNFFPRYFPDGSRLLYSHVEIGSGKEKGAAMPSSELRSVGLGGSSAVTEYCPGFTPSFVPKTDKVVLVRPDCSGKSTELHLVDLVTGSDTCIFGVSGRGVADPEVSPSGTMVAFVSMTEAKKEPANLDIYTINIDGSGLKQRTFFPGQDLCPRWSADGKSLLFLSSRGTEKESWNVWKLQLPEFAKIKTDSAVQPSQTEPVAKVLADSLKNAPAVPAQAAPADSAQASTKPADSTHSSAKPADSAQASAKPADSTTRPIEKPADSATPIVKPADSAAATPVNPPAVPAVHSAASPTPSLAPAVPVVRAHASKPADSVKAKRPGTAKVRR